jgi:hypothetical protein
VTFTIKPRRDGTGFNLESEALSPRGLWYGNVDYAVGYAQHRAGSERATIQVFDAAGALVQTITHEPNRRENCGTLGVI